MFTMMGMRLVQKDQSDNYSTYDCLLSNWPIESHLHLGIGLLLSRFQMPLQDTTTKPTIDDS